MHEHSTVLTKLIDQVSMDFSNLSCWTLNKSKIFQRNGIGAANGLTTKQDDAGAVLEKCPSRYYTLRVGVCARKIAGPTALHIRRKAAAAASAAASRTRAERARYLLGIPGRPEALLSFIFPPMRLRHDDRKSRRDHTRHFLALVCFFFFPLAAAHVAFELVGAVNESVLLLLAAAADDAKRNFCLRRAHRGREGWWNLTNFRVWFAGDTSEMDIFRNPKIYLCGITVARCKEFRNSRQWSMWVFRIDDKCKMSRTLKRVLTQRTKKLTWDDANIVAWYFPHWGKCDRHSSDSTASLFRKCDSER